MYCNVIILWYVLTPISYNMLLAVIQLHTASGLDLILRAGDASQVSRKGVGPIHICFATGGKCVFEEIIRSGLQTTGFDRFQGFDLLLLICSEFSCLQIWRMRTFLHIGLSSF